MDIVTGWLAGFPVLRIKDPVDHSVADEFAEAVRKSLDGEGRLLLDLRRCIYMDSGGLAVMIAAVRDLPPDGWLGVAGCTKNLRRLFEIVGLLDDPRFRVFDDMSQAEQSLDQAQSAAG